VIRKLLAAVLVWLLAIQMGPPIVGAQSSDLNAPTTVLAPVGRQVGWLNLVAPRPKVLTHFDAPDYVSDVAVNAGASLAALVVVRTTTSAPVSYGEILCLDLTTLSTSRLSGGTDPGESLGAPVWWPDNRRLLFQREDITTVGMSYAGGATVQYPSRIEQVNVDGSGRTIVAENGRQPAASPDGDTFAFVRRTVQGPTLVVRSLFDTSEHVLIEAGQFGDIISPRFSPGGDRIAFMAPVGVFGKLPEPISFGVLLGAPTRFAHGAPWDLWVVSVDGSSPPLHLGQLGADDGSVAWSPDGAGLFVYGGAGSFIVDANTAEVTPLSYIAGYGTTSWVPEY
jgi:Tol biopolymer transport system component